MRKVLATILVAGLWTATLWGAGRLELEGDALQGGLLYGQVEPRARVSFQGRELRVAEDGRFLIGLDRDAPLKTSLNVVWPDGGETSEEVLIGQRAYDVQRIDGLPPRKVTPEKRDLKRIRREVALVKEARRRDDPRTDFDTDWIWPTRGVITGVYGSQRILNGEPRRPHYGVDIAAPAGTAVRAPAAGIVTVAHPDMFFSGGTLIVDHGHGLSSAFLHLSRITVNKGDRVEQGDKIAEVGATGRVTGAHLDWRMNWFDRRVDPSLLVPAMPES